MRKMVQIAVLTAFILPAAQAEDCMDQAEDQLQMNICAQNSYQAADAELNQRFNELRQRIGDDANTRSLLREAERAWLAFRDAECTFAASATLGGSANVMIYDNCLTDLTQQRSEQFLQYLNCEEGDLSCPVPGAG